MIEFQPIFISVGAALIYSLLWYSRKVIDPTKPTPSYDLWQLGATLLIGGGIGVVSIISGVDLTQIGVETQLAAYGGIIAVVEQVGKALFRNFYVRITEGV
jgi:hypothetical protein